MHCSVPYIYSFGLLLAEIELVPQRCNIQILKGAGGEWLVGRKGRQMKDGEFVERLMKGDVSSHTLTVSSTRDQLQLSQTGAMTNFTREMWKNMRFLSGLRLEMTLVLDGKSTVSRGVSLPACVPACLSVCLFPPAVL